MKGTSKQMKIILNKKYGGFGASYEAYKLYAEKKGLPLYLYSGNFCLNKYRKVNELTTDFGIYTTEDNGDQFDNDKKIDGELNLDESMRTDKTFIEVVKELGSKANDRFSNLVIVTIPNKSHYIIDECDGFETLYYSSSEIKTK